MRIATTIGTPKHAHIWRHPIDILRRGGHQVAVLLRDYRETLPVAEGLGLGGDVFGHCRGGSARRMLEYPTQVWGHWRLARRFKPDILAGYGVYEAHSARALGRPSVAFNDTELAPGQNRLIRALASTVCVPESFQGDAFGDKMVRFRGYLELAYLHPTRYHPDPGILNRLGVAPGEPYALLRFNALDATHDVGAKGFTPEDQRRLVARLSEHGRVFVSAEGGLPKDLADHALATPPHQIHDALTYASLYIGDSGTMQNEAAILGTPSIRYTQIPKELDRGNSIELEDRYGLLRNVRDADAAIELAVEWFADPTLKQEAHDRRLRMLTEQIDVAAFMAWFLTSYPASAEELHDDCAGVNARFVAGDKDLERLVPRPPPRGV